jgi:hypothetical protein
MPPPVQQGARQVLGFERRLKATGDCSCVPEGEEIVLTRHAVERVTDGMLHIDDSSGIIGHDLRDLTGLYARACAIAPPDPAKLAEWLVASRCDGPGWPDFDVADFAPALGEAGLAELAARSGAQGRRRARFVGVSSLRKELAAVAGDVDAHVAVLAEEARGGRDYGEIVSVLRKAGRDRDAEEWARKGLAAEPSSPWNDPLREQLADLLLGSGRGDEAVAMVREALGTGLAWPGLKARAASEPTSQPAIFNARPLREHWRFTCARRNTPPRRTATRRPPRIRSEYAFRQM